MPTRAARRRARIAVIDDDPDVLGLMQETLAESGYDVDLMRGLRDAHEHVRATHPDVVLCDLIIGREECGWRLVELLTLQGIEAIAKPFDLPRLLGAIELALAPKRRVTRM